MNIATILEAVRPLADLSHDVVHTHQDFQSWAPFGNFKGSLDIYKKALEALSFQALNLPKASVPDTVLETIQKLAFEANQRLAPVPRLSEKLGQYFKNLEGRENIDAPGRPLLPLGELNKMMDDCPIPTIDTFYLISKRSTGVHYGSQFRIDPNYLLSHLSENGEEAKEWTWDFRSPMPLMFFVHLNKEATGDMFEGLVGTLPQGGRRQEVRHDLDDRYPMGWVVGLTCDEREMLLLHPAVKCVGPEHPMIHLEMHGIL